MVALGAAFLSFLGSTAALLDISRPDSKVARNVLEGKTEGYCSVSRCVSSLCTVLTRCSPQDP